MFPDSNFNFFENSIILQRLIVTVDNREVLKAQDIIAKNGLYLKPSGALSFAGAMKLNLENKKVICIGTWRN